MSARIWLVSIGFSVAVTTAATGFAQGRPLTRVDFGLSGVAMGQGEPGTAIAPSLGVHFTPDDVIEGSFDRVRTHRDYPFAVGETRHDYVTIQYRRVLARLRHATVSATAGVSFVRGYERYETSPAYVAYGYNDEYSEKGVGPATGIEVDWALTERLAVRTGVRLGITSNGQGSVRGAVGVIVPLDGRPLRRKPAPTRAWDDPLSGVARHVGARVWITTASGQPLAGRLEAVDDHRFLVDVGGRTIDVPLAEITRVDAPDGIHDGSLRGLGLGALGGGLIGAAVCRCDEYTVFGVIAGAATGSVFGTIGGLIIDSLTPHRQTVFDRRTARREISLAPIFGTRAAGVGGRIRW
jgi:small nuclear ribonucleoprotein (snRNP)-like protein